MAIVPGEKTVVADRYEIERELGRGGMATVYLARDLRHERLVALKVLSAEVSSSIMRERFLREIRIAAGLSHPHILTLHDSGETDGLLYYVMPYVEGETLRDRLRRERELPLADAASITRQVAAALDHAHRRGVVHRDVKPENILLHAGEVLVADFGIAHAAGVAAGDRLTVTGISLGTPLYMSPEQGAGDREVDGRTDIYALGCVLYEMLAGAPPFAGPTPQAILARKAVESVPSLRVVRDGVSPSVEAVVQRALARVPADRFATAAEFAQELDRALAGGRVLPPRRVLAARPLRTTLAAGLALGLGAGGWWLSTAVLGAAPARVRSVAVLPFDNMSGDSTQEYLVAGMHDALIGELARIGALRVISRRSVMRYGDSDKPIPELARELGVDAVVEGTVARAGDSVRVQVQLIEARREERHVWAQAYDRDMRGLAALHGDVAGAIARAVGVTPAPGAEARLARARAVSPETYEAYLRGMYYLGKMGRDNVRRGLAYLHEAVERDPGDAMAYAGLAAGYITLGHSPLSEPGALTRARAAALRAVTLDSTLAEAHSALATVKLYYERDWEGAERGFLRANALNPNLAMNHYHYAWYLALFDRMEEAIAEHKRAQELDPLTALHTAWLGGLYSYAGRNDEAIAEARKALEMDTDFPPGLYVLGKAYAAKGMYREAIEAHRRLVEVAPFWKAPLGRTYALAGRISEARAILREVEAEPLTPFGVVSRIVLYTAVGDLDEAFRWMAHKEPHGWLWWARVAPEYAALREDPRFGEFLRRAGLPPLTGRGMRAPARRTVASGTAR